MSSSAPAMTTMAHFLWDSIQSGQSLLHGKSENGQYFFFSLTSLTSSPAAVGGWGESSRLFGCARPRVACGTRLQPFREILSPPLSGILALLSPLFCILGIDTVSLLFLCLFQLLLSVSFLSYSFRSVLLFASCSHFLVSPQVKQFHFYFLPHSLAAAAVYLP